MSKKRENYSNQPFGTPRRRAKRTFLGALFVIVLLAVTISFTVALVIAYLTPYVSPSTFGSLTIVGIFAPILYAAVAVCMLLWLVTGRWKTALLVAIFLIPGAFRITDFYNIAFMREVEQKHSRNDLTMPSARCAASWITSTLWRRSMWLASRSSTLRHPTSRVLTR